jgi:hypothetical protein
MLMEMWQEANQARQAEMKQSLKKLLVELGSKKSFV